MNNCGSDQGEDTLNKPLKGLFSIVTSDNKFQYIVIIFPYRFPLTKSASLPSNGARECGCGQILPVPSCLLFGLYTCVDVGRFDDSCVYGIGQFDDLCM